MRQERYRQERHSQVGKGSAQGRKGDIHLLRLGGNGRKGAGIFPHKGRGREHRVPYPCRKGRAERCYRLRKGRVGSTESKSIRSDDFENGHIPQLFKKERI